MNIGIFGTGYVGLITAAILSKFHKVFFTDSKKEKIEKLNNKELTIFEKGLEEIFNKNLNKSLFFSTDPKEVIESSEFLYIAVGTPPNQDGSADLKYVCEVARVIGQNLNSHKTIVIKSTVPIGTSKKVRTIISEELLNRKIDVSFDVVSNPEFLREGNALFDVLNPDRIIIGTESEKAFESMKELYSFHIENKIPILHTNNETAELIKYASNAFLAVKISYINEISNLAEKVGANILEVSKGIGMDRRIGNKFLNAGCGFGGSCFPKDTKALIEIAKKNDVELKIVESAIKANQSQKERMVEKIVEYFGNLEGKTIGILGLTFKADTDDTRESPSLYIIQELVRHGANIKVYDPKGMEDFKWRMVECLENIRYCKDEYEVADESDCLVILTDWKEFKDLNFSMIRELLKDNVLFDFRNMLYSEKFVRNNFKYFGVGI